MKNHDVHIKELMSSAWRPLRDAWLGTSVPDLPGLYRIRRVGRADLVYIGQTGSGGMTLRKRLGILRGVYGERMPYRDPHTAGPALWALRHATSCAFEVSVLPVEGSTPWRKGLACVAISLYRQKQGASPTVNFGRMPAGYRISRGINARTVAAGKRFRGGPFEGSDASHLPGIAPVGELRGNPLAGDWCGHVWSLWCARDELGGQLPSHAKGLYRIRRAGEPDTLLYIGQGRIRSRLNAHQRKAGNSVERQAEVFAGPLECSWVLNDAWYPHQRLELENDLIAIAGARCF